jgi:hypothetical protein
VAVLQRNERRKYRVKRNTLTALYYAAPPEVAALCRHNRLLFDQARILLRKEVMAESACAIRLVPTNLESAQTFARKSRTDSGRGSAATHLGESAEFRDTPSVPP